MTQEALKLALEALEYWDVHGKLHQPTEEAITAIKEALAKEKTLQALHSENKRLGLYKDAYAQQEQKPVAWWVTNPDGEIDWCDEPIQYKEQRPLEELIDGCGYAPLYTTPPQRTEQEPVAWMYQEYRDDDQFGWRDEIQFVQPPNDPNYFRNIVPVYTTSPQRIWQGLTNEEVESYWDWEDFQCGCGRGTLLEMVLDIQAKLKERNT